MRDEPTVIILEKDAQRLGVCPRVGGAIVGWEIAGQQFLEPVSDPALVAQQGLPVGAYPLIPYSNRIAGGVFVFDETVHRLAPNMRGEQSSIHGNAWERAWDVQPHDDPTVAILTLDHQPQMGDPVEQWPFAYHARLCYKLLENGLEVRIAVENRADHAQPIGLGFHPFFPRNEKTRVQFDVHDVWLPDAHGLPQSRVPAAGNWSFAVPKSVAECTIDHCFAGWNGRASLLWPERGTRLDIEADPVFSHLVMFTRPDKPFVALEPVTNMNDAIHHPDIPDRGLHILPPGGLIEGGIRFCLKDA